MPVSPARTSRRFGPGLAVGLLLAVIPGCSWVHQRQALDANRPTRVVDRLLGARKPPVDRPPSVLLRVDPLPASEIPADDDAR